MKLASSAFDDGGRIPTRHCGTAENISPEVSFGEVPSAAKELVLVCFDPDASGGWTHWLVYGISPKCDGLPESLPKRQFVAGAIQGLNSWGALGWGGPFPPRGPVHRYLFTLSALSVSLRLEPGRTREKMKSSMQGRVLAEAVLTGIFGR